MRITRIKAKHFRNYNALELEPDPGVNLFFGENGSGKTNLLEAVHYCALGRSHRTAQDREVIARVEPSGACGVTLEKRDGTHEVAVRLLREGVRKKQVFLDGKKAPRLASMMGLLQCVSFSPEDLDLVKEGPAVRRRFLDMLLSQLSSVYFTALQVYQQALQQRNALLRAAKTAPGMFRDDSFSAWEESMAKAAETLIPARAACCEELAEEARRRYASVSGREEERMTLVYRPCVPPEGGLREAVLRGLRASRKEDLRRGMTCFGPHREDLRLLLEGKEMRLFASQGQIRTAALALKLSELSVFQKAAGEPPVLLLDDVMSELDLTRRRRLLDEIRGVQTFLTCTDESDLDSREKYFPWQVTAGTCASIASCRLQDRPARLQALDDSFLGE